MPDGVGMDGMAQDGDGMQDGDGTDGVDLGDGDPTTVFTDTIEVTDMHTIEAPEMHTPIPIEVVDLITIQDTIQDLEALQATTEVDKIIPIKEEYLQILEAEQDLRAIIITTVLDRDPRLLIEVVLIDILALLPGPEVVLLRTEAEGTLPLDPLTVEVRGIQEEAHLVVVGILVLEEVDPEVAVVAVVVEAEEEVRIIEHI